MQLTVRARTRAGWILACALVLVPRALVAQTIVDPRTVEFTPSPQHDEVTSSGVAVVTSYSLAVYVAGQNTPQQTVSLGKPTPGTDGMIRLDFVSRLSTPLATGVSYQARVSAIGPGGSAASELSNAFTFAAPCTYSLGSTGTSVAAAGGAGTVNVSTASGCTWTATSSASWLSIVSPAGGKGVGPAGIAFNVAPNPNTSSRTAVITVEGRSFTVTQAANSCTYTVTPSSASPGPEGGTGTVTVTANMSACSWSSNSPVTWVTIDRTVRTGSGSITYTVLPNTGPARSTTLTIAGRPVAITQREGTPPIGAPTNLRIIK
jgi:hypothetical protein